MRAVVAHALDGGSGDEPAGFARWPRAHSDVVAVKQDAEVGVEGAAVAEPFQDKGLEEPAGVGEMPLDGTGVRH